MKTMISYSRKRIRLFVACLALFCVSGVRAQEVQVQVSAPSAVEEGQQFRLSYVSNEKISNLNLPSIKDFTLLGGPTTSSSTSMQIINGQMSRSSSYTYTYVLQAGKAGNYTIAPATVQVGGKNYKTNSVSIRVVAGGAQASAPSGNGGGNRSSAAESAGAFRKDDVFVRAEVSKTNPYVEEEVLVTYKLYVPEGVRFQSSIKKMPSYTGLWTYELGDRNVERKPYRETYNGKAYTVIDLISSAVYPQKAGALSIPPVEVEMLVQVVVQQPRSNDPWEEFFNNPFFGRQNVQQLHFDVRSKAVGIQAKELPAANRPADFSGLVGHFTLKGELSRNELNANDAANLTLTLSGKGNLQHAEVPALVFPSDISAQEPSVTDKLSTLEKAGVSGSRVFEYILIPRQAGEYEIPAASFSYFDPVARHYVTLHTRPYTLKVAKGDPSAASSVVSSNKKDVKVVGNDIRFIRTSAKLQKGRAVFFLSPLYWVLLCLPMLLCCCFILLSAKRIRERENVVMFKDKKASKVARKRLKTAGKYLKAKDDSRFYEEISQVLWGYVSDKFHIPMGQLSMETARQKLSERNMSAERIDEFMETLNQCEYVRFAPSAETTPEKMYEKTFAFLTRMEQELKKA